jgi:hypothetical protein
MRVRKPKRCRAASPDAAGFLRAAGFGDPALQFSNCIVPAQKPSSFAKASAAAKAMADRSEDREDNIQQPEDGSLNPEP